MYYTHEQQESKKNTHPMCTALPPMTVDRDAGLLCNEYLLKRNLDPVLAQDNGWFPSREAGDSFLRIVIPCVTHKTAHVYWQARNVTGKAYLRYQSPKGPRHEALCVIHPEQETLGNVVVEGPLDALAAAGAGYTGYSLMGMKPSQATLTHLALLLTTSEGHEALHTLICLDRGEVANGIKVATFLASQSLPAAVAELPEKDLAECLPKVREKFLHQSFKHLFKSRSSVKRLQTGPCA